MRWMLRISLEAAAIFVLEMILSFISTSLFTRGVIPQNYTACVLLAIVCLAITIVLLVVSMIHKANRGFAPIDIAVSYMTVFIIFAVVSIFLALIGMDKAVTYMFLAYKVFAFKVLPPLASVFIVNAIIGGVCIVTPVLCNKQFEAERIRSYLKNDDGIDS